MQSHNIETSIRTLKNLRDTYHSQLHIRVVEELNTVISELEAVSQQGRSERRSEVCLRALRTVGDVIRLVSNISDLM